MRSVILPLQAIEGVIHPQQPIPKWLEQKKVCVCLRGYMRQQERECLNIKSLAICMIKDSHIHRVVGE